MNVGILFVFLFVTNVYGSENITTSTVSTETVTPLPSITTTTTINTNCNTTTDGNTTIPPSCITSTTVTINATQSSNDSNLLTSQTPVPDSTTQPPLNTTTTTGIPQLENTTALNVENATSQETILNSTTTSNLNATVASTITTENVTSEVTEQTIIIKTTVPVTDEPTEQNTETTISDNLSNVTTSPIDPTIVQRIKDIWNESLEKLNFSSVMLSETDMFNMTSSNLIDVMVEYFLTANTSQLEVIYSDSLDLAYQILTEKPALLETEIREQFNSSQNTSLHALFASFYWFHDEILLNNQSFQLYYDAYTSLVPPSGSNDTDNNTVSDTTPEKFIRYILNNANTSSLLSSLCEASKDEGISGSVCPTSSPATTATSNTLPGPEIFESTWNTIITGADYDFMTDTQVQQLQSITPENMTTALINYVKDLTNDEIAALVEANVTRYVNSVLRNDGKQAVDTIGDEAVQAFSGSSDREDVFYVYLNLLNNLFSNATKFQEIMRGYVNNSTPTRRKRDTSDCNKDTINPDGVCCYTIVSEGSDVKTLQKAVCGELNAGSECTDSFTIQESEVQSTTAIITPISHGLTTWEIVGIALGAFFALLLLCVVMFFVWKRCVRRKSKINPQANGDRSSTEMEEPRSEHSTRMRPLSSNGHASISANSSGNP